MLILIFDWLVHLGLSEQIIKYIKQSAAEMLIKVIFCTVNS